MNSTASRNLAARPTQFQPIGLLLAVLSLGGTALFLQSVLESPALAQSFVSDANWPGLLKFLGGSIQSTQFGPLGTVPLLSVLGLLLVAASMVLALPVVPGTADNRAERLNKGLGWIAIAGCLPTVWWVANLVVLLAGWEWPLPLVQGTAELTAATGLAIAGYGAWSAGWGGANRLTVDPAVTTEPVLANRSARLVLLTGMLTYAVVWTGMNWGLWFNLLLPHGDSAMYEEHLWNLEHGKGFRSYLDQGLFLGEHLQVVHVLLIPLHLLFPSHLTLELAQSVILALGAIPVFNIARRHSRSEWAAALLGLAYLAYFPLQYLDIAIDLKTFRPNSFGIPTLLAAIDLLERRKYGWACFWLAITLSAQEDWAIPIALLGGWLVLSNRPLKPVEATGRTQLLWGLGLAGFGVFYLWFALGVAIPWFREGAMVHTASYFSKFGASPGEIIVTLLTRPWFVITTVVTPGAVLYALRMLLPIGFLPLGSPGRLLVAAPLFLLLLMNDLAMETPAPVHHFHAPLIPLLFWAAAAGLGKPVTSLRETTPDAAATIPKRS